MTDVQRHVAAAYEALRLAHGEFDFFALLEPEESLGRWDLMLSAPWLTDTLDGRATLDRTMTKHLTRWDWNSLGYTVIRPADYDGIPELAATQPPGTAFPATVANIEIGGAPIRQAVIFKLPPRSAKRPPAVARR